MPVEVRTQVCALLLLLAALTTSSPQVAHACIYHGSMAADYALARPHAIYVELAAHQAIRDGTLASPPAAAPPALAALRVNRWLRDVASVLNTTSKKNDSTGVTFALLVADAGLWSRYRVDGESGHIDIHVPGPDSERVVIVTNEAVLAALATGQMRAKTAIQKGMIAIVGEDEDTARVTALLVAAL